jgi:hypothetical protein
MAVGAEFANHLSPGMQLGPYRVLALLGRGGMGEVYRARDTRLHRDIALKVIRGAENPLRLRRFEREARAASALNHPSIVVVHEFGEAQPGGQPPALRYIAMELLEGKSLDTILLGGPLPLRQALEIASQLADGLARTHESGILHRDLKPSNVIVTPDGRVKILDFGLALEPEPAEPERAVDTPTTASGVPLGTVGYMAPEQARGDPASPAADQFAFGCVLYEMLTGRRAFQRASPAETLTALLRDEPSPIQERSPEAPAPLRWIVERCLAKLPEDRYASTRDLARDLQNLKSRLGEARLSAPASGEGPVRPRPPWLRAAVLGLLAGAVMAAAFLTRRDRAAEPVFHSLTFRRGNVYRALFAPNGSILYAASWEGQPPRTYLALPDSPGSDRELDSEPRLPLAFNLEGDQVLVLDGLSRFSIDPHATLAWWPALGGKPRPILRDAGWADWAPRGRFLAVVRDSGPDRVLEIRDSAGSPRGEIFRTSGAISSVRISPDEARVAFCHHPRRSDDADEVRVAFTDGKTSKALTPTFERCAGVDWDRSTGEVWFSFRSEGYTSALAAVTTSGRSRPLHGLPDFFRLESVGPGGRALLLWVESRLSMTVTRADGSAGDLSWMGWSVVNDISPDGRSVLFHEGGTEKARGLWIRPLDGGEAMRLGDAEGGTFSPDGQRVAAFTRSTSGPVGVLVIPVGAGETRRLSIPDVFPAPPSFAGPTTLLLLRSGAKGREVWRIETDGSRAKRLGTASCHALVANPAGTALLCATGEVDHGLLVYPVDGGPGRELLPPASGRRFAHFRWDGTGRRVFAVTDDGRLMTVDALSGRVLAASRPAMPPRDPFLGAAVSAEGTVQVFSAPRFSSRLYLASGLSAHR